MSNTETSQDRTEILARILELCKKPTAKIRIIHKTNTFYLTGLMFISRLQKIGMLNLDHDSKKYETTEKGSEYLKNYSELQKLLKR
jgi:predicted transcriptional regulator